jgi:hypothetical protein
VHQLLRARGSAPATLPNGGTSLGTATGSATGSAAAASGPAGAAASITVAPAVGVGAGGDFFFDEQAASEVTARNVIARVRTMARMIPPGPAAWRRALLLHRVGEAVERGLVRRVIPARSAVTICTIASSRSRA